MTRRFFPYVDVLRAVAVLLVLVYHVIVQAKWDSFPKTGLLATFQIGWIGVELFFVISGFVITLSCVRNVEVHGAAAYRRPFMASRLIRIVPLYVLTSWCHLVLVEPQTLSLPPRALWTNLILHATFLHNLSPLYAGALNGPAWSIGVEMQFYVFMALLFIWLPTRRPLLLAALAVLVALLWRAAMLFSFDPQLNVIVLINRTQQLPGTLDAFGLGCMLALITQNSGHWAHRFTQASWRNSARMAVVALLMSAVTWHIFWPRATVWNLPWMVVGLRTLLALTFLFWLWAVITLPVSRRLTAGLWPITYVGKISYGIYLWHMLVIVSLLRVNHGSPWSIALVATALTVLISAFTWHFLEHPLMRQHADNAAGGRGQRAPAVPTPPPRD